MQPNINEWFNKGTALSALGEYNKAIEAYDNAIAIDRNYKEAWNNKGNALSALGEYNKAIEAYDRAIAIYQNYKTAKEGRELTIKKMALQEAIKKSRASEEIIKSKRMVVETLGRLTIIHAESENKTELLNVLEDLKFYTVKNLEDLSKATEYLEFMMKNESRFSEKFVSEIKNLVHRIRREYEL